ncbi:MAG: glucosamine-6-phosphate deaminase [Cyanobium sp.]
MAPGWCLIPLDSACSVSERVASRLLSERRFRPERPLGLATGRTMEPVYEAMVHQVKLLPEAEQLRLRERWLSFNLDEYVGLPADDPRSFRAAMEKQLVHPLGLDPEQVRLPCGHPTDPAAEAERYASELQAAGGIGLQVLGLGLNGHVGFNEPPCPAEAPCRCVPLSASTRQANATAFGGDPAAVPPQAITLGLRDILAAAEILLVVTGAAKAPVLRRLLQEPPGPDLPASWLRQHPRVTVLADRHALG